MFWLKFVQNPKNSNSLFWLCLSDIYIVLKCRFNNCKEKALSPRKKIELK